MTDDQDELTPPLPPDPPPPVTPPVVLAILGSFHIEEHDVGYAVMKGEVLDMTTTVLAEAEERMTYLNQRFDSPLEEQATE